MFHIFSPKSETLALLWYTDLTSGPENLDIYLKLYQLLLFCVKVSFRIVGDRFLAITKHFNSHRLNVPYVNKIEPSIYSYVVLKTMTFHHCK